MHWILRPSGDQRCPNHSGDRSTTATRQPKLTTGKQSPAKPQCANYRAAPTQPRSVDRRESTPKKYDSGPIRTRNARIKTTPIDFTSSTFYNDPIVAALPAVVEAATSYSAPAASGGQPLGLTGRRPSSDRLERGAG